MTRPAARWPLVAAIGLGVPGLHVALLLAWGGAVREAGIDPGPQRSPMPSMQVRSVPQAMQLERETAAVSNQTSPATRAPEATAPVAIAVARPATNGFARTGPAAPSARPAAVATEAIKPVSPSDISASAPADAPPAAVAFSRALPVPVYATRLPPSGRWRYRMTRGAASGEAELAFSLDASEAAGYVLQLEGRVAGAPVLEWASRGQIDAAGLAPDRFALRRRGRDRQAANFQREAGKITFSGPTHEQALPPGAQDRLSWLLQLPAIVAAAPERFVAGASVVLFVAGARGDADIWTFVVEGREMHGDIDTLKLVRQPQKPYDTRAEVWLDPARLYLPHRVQQTPSGGGAALDLVYEPLAP